MPKPSATIRTWVLISAVFILAAAEVSAQDIQYEVKSGDTLYSIARTNNLSVQELMDANGIDDARGLRIGQMLTIPGTQEQLQIDYSTDEYEVTSGDTLYSIARRYEMSVGELLSINNLNESDIIKPGQLLSVRQLSSSQTTTVVTVTTPDPPVQTVSIQTTEAREGTIMSSKPSVGGDEQFWPHDGERYEFDGKFPGIVIRGNIGDDIRAVSPGRVVYSGPHSTLGNVLFIQNPRGFIYIYGGNRDLLVGQGDEVQPGQILGTLGPSPLLPEIQVYFSVWKEGRYVDPTTAPR